MPSVTADTNIYISALNFGGQPLRFLDLARTGGYSRGHFGADPRGGAASAAR